jgi:hypothetical protein
VSGLRLQRRVTEIDVRMRRASIESVVMCTTAGARSVPHRRWVVDNVRRRHER